MAKTSESQARDKPSIRARLLPTYRGSLVFSLFLSIIYLSALHFAYSENGTGRAMEIIYAACGFATIFAFLSVIAVLPFLFVPRLKGKFPIDSRIPSIFFIACIICLIAGDQLRMFEFSELAKRSEPLIEAIEKYEKDVGNPPQTLGMLVPAFIKKVPSTGMGAYPRFEFDVLELDGKKVWELKVPCSIGFVNWDVFFYRSSKKYETREHGGTVTKMGDWAYVHE